MRKRAGSAMSLRVQPSSTRCLEFLQPKFLSNVLFHYIIGKMQHVVRIKDKGDWNKCLDVLPLRHFLT